MRAAAKDLHVKDLAIPPDFVARMKVVYGDAGVEWATHLPETVEALACRRQATLGPTVEPLTYSFVAEATMADGRAAMLRIAYPGEEQTASIRAMVLYAGDGAARVLAHDEAEGAMLMERVTPGTPLSRAALEEESTAIAAAVMRRLWRPLPDGHGFFELPRWTRELREFPLDGAPGYQRLPRETVVRAQGMLQDLLASEGPPVLLHGDLHHENILDAGEGRWLAIDPKGLAGEREFDIGAFMMNPIPGLLAMERPGAVLERRIEAFATELGFDGQRVRAWSFVYPVLSAAWSARGGDGSYGIRVAQLLEPTL